LNKNKKIIKKIDNIEKISLKKNYNKKNFIGNKFNKNSKMSYKSKKKFRYHSKIKKNNFENKKLANY